MCVKTSEYYVNLRCLKCMWKTLTEKNIYNMLILFLKKKETLYIHIFEIHVENSDRML